MTFKKYGLIGEKLSHSFSKEYFNNKFREEELNDCQYDNYEIDSASDLAGFLQNTNCLGLNVTIPYKEDAIVYLDELDKHARKIGAVNTILIKDGIKKGFNTDYLGFQQSLMRHIEPSGMKALILGTGGSSKAVKYALDRLQILSQFVSRSPGKLAINYSEIDEACLHEHKLIINCTPLGMWPKIEEHPPIPFNFIGDQHFVVDLIYNPKKTKLLELSEMKGARTMNGMEMLELQAEESWKIWNS